MWMTALCLGIWMSQEIKLDSGLVLSCEVRGQKTGPPLLLIAGYANRGSSFTPLREILEPHIQVITYDHRGVGDSGDVEGPYNAYTMASEAAELMQKLGYAHYAVAGISLGSLVAQKLALDHPDPVQKLILIATTTGGPQHVAPDPEVLQFLLLSSQMDWKESVEKGAPFAFHPDFLKAHPESIEAWLKAASEQPVSQATRQRQTMAGMFFDSSSLLSSIKAPTLVIHGAEDRIVPAENGRRVHALIPESQFVEIPQSGHICILDQTEAVARAILGFLEEGRNSALP